MIYTIFVENEVTAMHEMGLTMYWRRRLCKSKMKLLFMARSPVHHKLRKYRPMTNGRAIAVRLLMLERRTCTKLSFSFFEREFQIKSIAHCTRSIPFHSLATACADSQQWNYVNAETTNERVVHATKCSLNSNKRESTANCVSQRQRARI